MQIGVTETAKPQVRLISERKKERKAGYANKVTPVCVNKGKKLQLVQAPGKPPPSN